MNTQLLYMVSVSLSPYVIATMAARFFTLFETDGDGPLPSAKRACWFSLVVGTLGWVVIWIPFEWVGLDWAMWLVQGGGLLIWAGLMPGLGVATGKLWRAIHLKLRHEL